MTHPVDQACDLVAIKCPPQYLQGSQSLDYIAWNHYDVVTMTHTSPISDFGSFLQVSTPYKWDQGVPLDMGHQPATCQRGLTRYKKVSCAFSGQFIDASES